MGDKNERTLSLLHLRKTFSEYNRISLSGTKEIDPNRLLPLFKNVSTMYNPVELRSEFKEAPSFALCLSTFFVREIRTRASTEGTEDAAILIADYLIPSPSQNRGFSILNTLSFLLQSEDEAIVHSMCKASIPSTIVKSLYLFFDLPNPEDDHIELRNQLNDVLKSLMKKLCTYKAVSEELTKKDDLALLFIATSSIVNKSNSMWRKTCCDILETLGGKSLSNVVIKYIKEKDCIGSFLANIQQSELNGEDGTEMTSTLFSLLRNSLSISNVLFQSFSAAGGFEFIKSFILRNEEDIEIIRSFLSMIITIITSGPIEIKPSISSGLISLPSFQLPSPTGNGFTVRNTEPFSFLFHIYCESKRSSTHLSIIDSVLSIYLCDYINYFILDRFLPLTSFIERLGEKDHAVQLKVIEIVEFLLFQLSYIPCKELIAFCVQSKTELEMGRTALSISFIQSSFKLLTLDPLIKDAYREVGLLDTLSFSITKLFETSKVRELSEDEYKLALLSTDLLTVTIKGNGENCAVFGDGMGPKKMVELIISVNRIEWRSSALQLLKQLLLLSSSDGYISSLLNSINDCYIPKDIPLTSELLKCLLGILRESHKLRILFRRSGGYICLISLLLSLESSLNPLPFPLIPNILPSTHIILLDFINLIFKVLTISMRFEPSNAKFFSVEVNWESVTTVLRLTAAFNENTELSDENEEEGTVKPLLIKCHQVFLMEEDIHLGKIPEEMPSTVFFQCYLIRLLFNMALDNYEKSASDVSFSMDNSLDDSYISWTSSVLVHPGAIISILQLIPSIKCDDSKWTIATRLYATLLVKSLLRPERNQQFMCQMEMPRHLLSICSSILLLDHHILLPHIYYLLERLSYQSMQPSQLRHFLRLDLPLCCRNLDEKEGEIVLRSSEGGPLPLSRVKALVSMITPRDQRLSNAPSFIEFDMMHEGFGCLFIPSLAPLSIANRTERAFPPLNGLSYSLWLYIDSFSDKKIDAHPLRLLTISRTISNGHKSLTNNISALTVQLSSIDRSLLISTEELENAGCDLDKERTLSTDKLVRIPLVDLIREREWSHLCIVLSRSVLKHSQVTVYLNGQSIGTHKIQYIPQNVGGGSSQLATTIAVNGTIGTPPSMRRPSRLRFRIASIFVIEDALSSEHISRIFSLNPHYIGSLQTISSEKISLVNEDKIVLSLNGSSIDELTITKMRGLHSKLDADMTASLLGLNPSDNSTPLRIILNASSHLSGGGRSFGGVVVGYLGMRTFSPRPVPRLIDSIGGYPSLFALVAMSTDSEGLYAALKALSSAVKSNYILYESINSNRAFQLLGILIEDKGHLLNSHIVHLIFSIVGTLNIGRDTITIPNAQAFDDLLADVEVWKRANNEMMKMLLEHIHELITDGGHMNNLPVIRSSNFLSRLLFTLLSRPSLLISYHSIIFSLIKSICQPPMDDKSLLKLGQFIASTLPSTQMELDEEMKLPLSMDKLHQLLFSNSNSSLATPSTLFNVYIRNRLLEMLDTFLTSSSPSIAYLLSDQLVKVLGFDWLICLMAPKIHDISVFLSLKILLFILSKNSLLQKFREGNGNGGWLSEAESVVRNSAATVLGFSVSADVGSIGSEIDMNPEGSSNGFSALQHIMAAHSNRPYVYIGMLSLLVGKPLKNLKNIDTFNVDIVWDEVFGLKGNSSISDAIHSIQFCNESLFVLFSIIRSCLYTMENSSDQSCNTQYPYTVLQVLTFLYQNSSSFFSIFHTEELIVLAFSSLIPEEREEKEEKEKHKLSREIDLTSPLPMAILDLINRILMDELQTNGSKKDKQIDALLEMVCDSSFTNRSLLQYILSTQLLHHLSYLLSTDLLVSSSLPPHSNSLSSLAIRLNIYSMCSRIVDGMWHSLMDSTFPLRFLNILYEVHSISTQRSDSKTDTNIVTNGIMRCVLYILSRPIDSIQQQMTVLDTLTTLVNKKYIFLQSTESWFFSSLAHIIFMLSLTPDILTTSDELDKTSAQISLTSARVWSDILVNKKNLVEETLRRSSVCELNGARALLGSVASEYWRAFVDGQLSKFTISNTTAKPQLQQQITEKITQMTSGFSRLSLLSRRSMNNSSYSSINIGLTRQRSISSEVLFLWLRIHSSLIRQLVQSQSIRYSEWHSHVRKWCLNQWSTLEVQLTRERAIWGPEEASSLDKFKLDTTEGPGRLRRKLIPNRTFYHDYPYRPYLEDPSAKALRAKVAVSNDSKAYYEAQRRRRPKTIDEGILEKEPRVISMGIEEKEELMDLDKLKSSLMKRVAVREKEEKEEIERKEKMEEDGEEDGDGKDDIEESDKEEGEGIEKDEKDEKNREEKKGRDEEKKEKRGPDNQTLLRLLEEGEQLHSMFRCARIQGLDTAEGLLLFGKDYYYVVDGFTLLKTREIRDLDFLPPDLHDPIVPYTATGTSAPPKISRICSKFSYDNIREVHTRRYLLQPIAIEVFSADGRNYLLAFPKRMRDRVYDKLLSMARGLRDGGNESVSGQRSNMAMEQSGRTILINSLIGQQSVTQRWLNGQISNFQYLMHLNTLAGRSYNDLSQYPIFPWILSDYSSSTLDLSNPSSFRDLSRPMGAQSRNRLDQFLKRYNEWDDPSGETPPYMYGTHYSSAMIVVSYLVRVEPFTQQFLSLQGGHFDLADRMFHSIEDAWMSASKRNMADVKELIPEFFFLPEMFMNKNRFDLGRKQNGISLDDIVLPAWAKDDPREFVRIHRMALESDYVSSHLHEWIDLIFGYKQSGEEAISSHNLFHHLFYEGNVNFDSIDDSLTRNATIAFVNNFGQIPSQLFKKPHPQKKVNNGSDLSFSRIRGVTTNRLFYHALHSLKPPNIHIKEVGSAIGALQENEKGIIQALPQNRLFVSTYSNKYLAWSFPDRSIRIGNIDSEKSTCILELNDTNEFTCAAMGDERCLFLGSSDGCISVWNLDRKYHGLTRRNTLDAHYDAITCLVVSSSHNMLVSSSRDCTAILWHLSDLSLIRQLPRHSSSISALAINNSTGDIATACGMELLVWSINGDLLSSIHTNEGGSFDSPHIILSIAFSTLNDWDADNVIITGGSDGVVSIYSSVVVENDGSLHKAKLDSKREKDSVSTINSRLERQRRRLKVGGLSTDTRTTSSSVSHSPDLPSSPLLEKRRKEGESEGVTNNYDKCEEFVRILVHRASLTTHTAFNRSDNPLPAPITAILPSKDHKSLYIGDGVGRVWQWMMTDDIGGRIDHWIQDIARQSCTQCQHNFSIADRKHHCRNCGQIFCAKCSRFESHITHMKISRPVRVCQACFVRLKAQNSK